jgi:hypothetical protein
MFYNKIGKIHWGIKVFVIAYASPLSIFKSKKLKLSITTIKIIYYLFFILSNSR